VAYGRLSEVVAGYDEPDRSGKCGLLARSLLAHGKAREAELWTRRAEAAGECPGGAARAAACSISCRHGSIAIPRSRSAGDDLRPRGGAGQAGGVAASAGPAAWPSEYPQIRAAVAARRYATAYDVLGKWPEALWTG